MSRLAAWMLAGALAIACTPDPPPHWAGGGAPLVIQPATWTLGDDKIEIRENGQVYEDGRLVLVIDRVGRVVDDDYEPIALLLPDGYVVGTENRDFGRIGLSNAAPPGQGTAWLSIMPDGKVVRFDADGERVPAGNWTGCHGPQQRTCTLVTHMVALRDYTRGRAGGVGVGFGVGSGIGSGVGVGFGMGFYR